MTTVAVDAYVIDVLLADLVGHDRRPSAFLVYLWLAVQAARTRGRPVRVSYQELADRTGLSKSAVQAAVRVLERRRLVQRHRPSPTATPEYRVLRPWVRSR
ncbi:MAG TPA: MarR family transcriptional regulator [Gemmatimonadales bacterium]|nr:MarR family transcriptional regulator [Gemmatimonadales bacterium]